MSEIIELIERYQKVGYGYHRADMATGLLIRRKDCLYRNGSYCSLHIMEQHELTDYDYCSRAERKEE